MQNSVWAGDIMSDTEHLHITQSTLCTKAHHHGNCMPYNLTAYAYNNVCVQGGLGDGGGGGGGGMAACRRRTNEVNWMLTISNKQQCSLQDIIVRSQL